MGASISSVQAPGRRTEGSSTQNSPKTPRAGSKTTSPTGRGKQTGGATGSLTTGRAGCRYPLDPLLGAAGLRDYWVKSGSGLVVNAPVTGLAVALGVHRCTVERAKRDGLTAERADKWAIKLGLHPGAVWPDLWWEAA